MSIPEALVRDHFAATFDGRTEVRTTFGRVDVVLGDLVVEVEPFRTWRHGVRQALAYAQESGKLPGVAIYGAMSRVDAGRIWDQCSGLVTVYLLDGTRWRKVAQASDTDREWAPPPDALRYRRRAPLRVLSDNDREALRVTAAYIGVSVTALMRMPVVQEWMDKRSTGRISLWDQA
jgi:hypothetical protein